MVRAAISSGSLVVVFVLWCCTFITAQRFTFSPSGCRTPDGQRGQCVVVQSCKPMSDYIKVIENRITDEIRNKMQQYVCGQEAGNPKVCCPPRPIGVPDLLPVEDCGITPITDKIVNGENASLYEFPWMSALLYSSRNGPEFKCGGTLINKRYILTAAHCIRTKDQLVGVRLGEHNLETETDCEKTAVGNRLLCAPPVQNFDVTVDDVIVHPKYNTRTLANDIALIRLRRDADLTPISVKPICLPIQKNTQRTTFVKKLTVCGWGTTEKGGYSPSLLKVVISAVDNDKCSQFYQEPIIITDQQMCAGGKNSQNSCSGDSGGPLMQQVVTDGVLRAVQYGIVSAGPILCEKKDFPVRYTRVTSYVDWIQATIKP